MRIQRGCAAEHTCSRKLSPGARSTASGLIATVTSRPMPPPSALVCLSALYAAKQYYDVAPAAGALLALAATWNAVVAAAAADTWRLNNAVRAEPLYPHKVAGMRSQTRLTIEAFEGLSL